MPVTFEDEKAASFGSVAESYDRVRPGPAPAALDWLVPDGCEVAVDLAAGTGLFTRELLGRAARVVAVEPDPRMREVLAAAVAGGGRPRGLRARPCRSPTRARTRCSCRPPGTGSTRRGRSPRSRGCSARAGGSASSGRPGTATADWVAELDLLRLPGIERPGG